MKTMPAVPPSAIQKQGPKPPENPPCAPIRSAAHDENVEAHGKSTRTPKTARPSQSQERHGPTKKPRLQEVISDAGLHPLFTLQYLWHVALTLLVGMSSGGASSEA